MQSKGFHTLILCSSFITTVGMMYQYFLKIVSTEFRFLNKQHLYTNQFAVTQHERVLGVAMSGLPGRFIVGNSKIPKYISSRD